MSKTPIWIRLVRIFLMMCIMISYVLIINELLSRSGHPSYLTGNGDSILSIFRKSMIILAIISGIFLIGAIIYYWIWFKDLIDTKVGLLCATAFDLVRMVENCSASGWKNAVKLDSDLTSRFAIEGTAAIIKESQLTTTFMGLNPTDTLNETGGKLRDYQQMRRTKFLQERGKIRKGISVFLLLVDKRNFSAAYRELVSYMVEQSNDVINSGPNFSHLKLFFDMTDEWPNESVDLDAYKKRSLSRWDFFLMNKVLNYGRKEIKEALYFQPPSGVEAKGEETMKMFRKFLHAGLEDL